MSSSRSKSNSSTPVALRANKLKFTPPSVTTAPSGELRPDRARERSASSAVRGCSPRLGLDHGRAGLTPSAVVPGWRRSTRDMVQAPRTLWFFRGGSVSLLPGDELAKLNDGVPVRRQDVLCVGQVVVQ